MIGKGRQPVVVMTEGGPIGPEVKFLVGVAKTVEEMVGREGRAAIEPAICRKFLDTGQPARAQGVVDQFQRGHREARVARAEAMGERAYDVVVRAAFGMGRQDRTAQLQIGMAARRVEIVVFEKGRRRQHDVGHRRSLGHKLLVDADEQILAREALTNETRIGGDDHRVGVLDEQRGDGRPLAEIAGIAHQNRADARLVENPSSGIEVVEPLDQCAVKRDQIMVRQHRATAFVLPGAGHRRQAGHGEDLRRAVSRARKPVTKPDEAAPGAAVEPGEIDDFVFAQAGDRRRPDRIAAREVRFETVGVVRVARHIGAVGIPFLEQDMHDGAGERPVGSRQRRQMQIGGLGAGGAVGVDHDELGAALLPRGRDMGHDVDLSSRPGCRPTPRSGRIWPSRARHRRA